MTLKREMQPRNNTYLLMMVLIVNSCYAATTVQDITAVTSPVLNIYAIY